jgi:hypothetical protein
LGAANLGVPFNQHFFDPRRADEKGAFNADAIACDPAYGKITVVASVT